MAKTRPTKQQLLSVANRAESQIFANVLRLCAGETPTINFGDLDERFMRIEQVFAILERAQPTLDEQAKRLVNAILTFDHHELDAYLDEHRK